MYRTNEVTKILVTKALYVACDLIVPGSGLLVKGVFTLSNLMGPYRMGVVDGKLGAEGILDLVGILSGADQSVIGLFLNFIMDFLLDLFTDL